jgi:hypothetical protein
MMSICKLLRKALVRHRFRSLVFVLSAAAFFAGYGHTQSASPNPNASEDKGIAALSDGTISGTTYQNPDLGIRYEIPSGWSANDLATQRQAIADTRQVVWTDDLDPRHKHKAARQCTKDLLMVTQYPEAMRVNDFNPFVLMIAADPKCSPGVTFPSTVKDRQAMDRIISQLATYFRTAAVSSKSPAEIRAYDNAGQVILEVSQRLRIDRHEPGTYTVQDIHTSVFLAQVDKYWLMWMFVGSDDGQLARLRATKIFFDATSRR